MAHDVTFSVPQRLLGKSDIEFVVREDGEKFGTLRISKGSLVWFPRNGVKGRKIGWGRFDAFMEDKPLAELRKRGVPTPAAATRRRRRASSRGSGRRSGSSRRRGRGRRGRRLRRARRA